MFSFLFEAVRPKLTLVKSIDEAALAVDEMLSTAYQTGEREDNHMFFNRRTLTSAVEEPEDIEAADESSDDEDRQRDEDEEDETDGPDEESVC